MSLHITIHLENENIIRALFYLNGEKVRIYGDNEILFEEDYNQGGEEIFQKETRKRLCAAIMSELDDFTNCEGPKQSIKDFLNQKINENLSW